MTGRSPNELITAGSMSVEDSGSALRQACAHARRIMLERAATDLGVEMASLQVTDGDIGVPGANRTVSYWDVQGGRPFGVQVRRVDRREVAGGIPRRRQTHRRIDLPAKVRGERYSSMISTAGPVARTRRCVRPDTTIGFRRSIVALEGDPTWSKLIVDGSFIAVVAQAEHAAVG